MLTGLELETFRKADILRLGSLEAEPEIGILVQLIYGGRTLWKRREGSRRGQGKKSSKTGFLLKLRLNFILWGVLECQRHQRAVLLKKRAQGFLLCAHGSSASGKLPPGQVQEGTTSQGFPGR